MKDGNEKQYDFVARSEEAATTCLDPSKTVQSDAQDADINVIIARFGLTGEVPTDIRMPTYQDFEDTFDYQTAQNVLIQARDEFMRLPANIRAKFDNDPAAFMDFVHDPANGDEMISLGLREKPVIKDVEAPPAAPVTE